MRKLSALITLVLAAIFTSPAFGVTIPQAVSITDLKTMVGATNGTVIRVGYVAQGDSTPFTYVWQSAACSLSSGAGDNATQVKPNTPVGSEGCYIAQLSSLTDISLWGAVGAGNDTATWTAANTSIGARTTAGISTPTVTCSKPTTITRIDLTALNRISGCDFNLVAGAANDEFVYYHGPGAFWARNVTFTCPLYDPLALTYSGQCTEVLYVLGANGVTIPEVHIENFKISGGRVGLKIGRANDVYVRHGVLDRAWITGAVLTDQSDDATYRTGNIYVDDVVGMGNGEYCISIPVNLPVLTGQLPTITAPRNLEVHASCYASGFLGPTQSDSVKECYDFTGTSFSQVTIDAVGINCGVGGAELKRTKSVVGEVVSALQDVNVKFTYHTNYDFGYGFDFPYELPAGGQAANPDQYQHINANLNVNFSLPPAWQQSWRYNLGDVVTAGGKTYIALQAGTSTTGSGPTCAGTTVGVSQVSCSDGGVVWLWLQTTPSVPSSIVGAHVEALTDAHISLTAYNTYYGFLLVPRGSSDATMRRVTLDFTGTTQEACMGESPIGNSFTTAGAFEDVTLHDWSCRSKGSNGALRFGPLSSGTSTWTGLVIDGGVFKDDLYYGLYTTNTTNLTGKIVGAPSFEGYAGGFYLQSPVSLVWSGGGAINVLSTSTDHSAALCDGISGHRDPTDRRTRR